MGAAGQLETVWSCLMSIEIMDWRPKHCHTSLPMAQSWMICSGDSSLALQISQVAESTMCFLTSTDRHLILLCVSSHINSWTLGGAKVFQMNFALGSFPWPPAHCLFILVAETIHRMIRAAAQIRHPTDDELSCAVLQYINDTLVVF
jgi:hypothetical protein